VETARIKMRANLNHCQAKKAESVTQPTQNFGGAKYFDFDRGTVFGFDTLIHNLLKHKITRHAINLGEVLASFPQLFTPMNSTKSADSSAWSNLASPELLIVM